MSKRSGDTIDITGDREQPDRYPDPSKHGVRQ